MTAVDVYNVAKALPKEEFNKLCCMINSENEKQEPKIKSRKKDKVLPIFTQYDCFEYLISHFNKERIP
jgi:hypothetical protein